jgi:Zn-dependent protease
MFITQLWEDPLHFIFWTVMVVFSVCVHELSHVYAALSQGDDTAARRGYLTLDPLKLMGIPSLVALAFIGIAWGAVPVTISRFRNRYSHALVSAAGPLANLALAVVFSLGTAFAYSRSGTQEAASLFTHFFSCGLQVNCMLALLNLLPIPMFDGWEVAALLFPALQRIPSESRQRGSWIALMLIFLTPLSDVLWKVAFALAELLLNAAGHVLPAAG